MFENVEPKVRNLVERIPRDTAYHLSQSSPYLRDNPMRERRKSEGHADALWLTANQMSLLFDRDEKTIRKHVNNVFSEGELEKDNNTQKMRVDGVKQKVPFYTLDVIVIMFIQK